MAVSNDPVFFGAKLIWEKRLRSRAVLISLHELGMFGDRFVCQAPTLASLDL